MRPANPAAEDELPTRSVAEDESSERASAARLVERSASCGHDGCSSVRIAVLCLRGGSGTADTTASDDAALETMTERLARIEKGKGPSDHNPLDGHASGSNYQPTSKKKGG